MPPVTAKRKPKAIDLQKPATLQLFWRWHDPGQTRRVWRSDWAGDQFEIVPSYDYNNLKRFCEMFAIPLSEVED